MQAAAPDAHMRSTTARLPAVCPLGAPIRVCPSGCVRADRDARPPDEPRRLRTPRRARVDRCPPSDPRRPRPRRPLQDADAAASRWFPGLRGASGSRPQAVWRAPHASGRGHRAAPPLATLGRGWGSLGTVRSSRLPAALRACQSATGPQACLPAPIAVCPSGCRYDQLDMSVCAPPGRVRLGWVSMYLPAVCPLGAPFRAFADARLCACTRLLSDTCLFPDVYLLADVRPCARAELLSDKRLFPDVYLSAPTRPPACALQGVPFRVLRGRVPPSPPPPGRRVHPTLAQLALRRRVHPPTHLHPPTALPSSSASAQPSARAACIPPRLSARAACMPPRPSADTRPPACRLTARSRGGAGGPPALTFQRSLPRRGVAPRVDSRPVSVPSVLPQETPR
jgi:hypothetical protein